MVCYPIEAHNAVHPEEVGGNSHSPLDTPVCTPNNTNTMYGGKS